MRDAQIVEEGKQSVEVEASIGKTGVDLIDLIPAFDLENVAKDDSMGIPCGFIKGDHGVHAEKGFLSFVDLMGVSG